MRALELLADQIVSANVGRQLVLLGIQRRGIPMAQRMADYIATKTGHRAPDGDARHQSLPGRSDEGGVAARRAANRNSVGHRRQGCHSRRRRPVHGPHRIAPHSSPDATSGECERFNWPCLSTADTGNCPSKPTSSARRSPRKTTKSSKSRLTGDRRRRRDLCDGKDVKRKDLLGIQELDARRDPGDSRHRRNASGNFVTSHQESSHASRARPSSISSLRPRLEPARLLRSPASGFPPTSSTSRHRPAASPKAKL